MSAWHLIFIIYMGAPTSQSSTPFETREQYVAAGREIARHVQPYVGDRYSAVCVQGTTAAKTKGESA